MATEWIYGRQVARLALAAGARRRAVRLAATAPALRALATDLPAGLETITVEAATLDRLTGSRDHQGVALEVPPFPYVEVETLLAGDLLVVLDEVSDPHNLGAVARSALAVGSAGLVVPRYRAAHVTPAAVKASAGALEHLAVAQVPNVARFLQQAKRVGLWVYGASAECATRYTDLDLRDRVVIVLGAEGHGLRPLVARACDALAAVPMRPPVRSLNVSVAAALFLFEAVRQRGADETGDPGSARAGRRADRGGRAGS
ncbi:MAG TPA: 23S rRNA (guanosine(2251)-2'-O)-methyltransferase RlmB [Thermoleophilia bacterium]|nr:23S rRNA (guanosine(2251)-2'-O)-methyltransferase RlmB [Thermoleophilia bacterium]HQJ97819.1 23S rRNA (guanosine(2251)-2'-O)-methyltransferase RlmB [Thermoleophilia bacterium]